MKMKSLSAFRITALCFAMAVSAGAQAFTKADSGWVRLFNGTDFTGIYSRNYGPVQPVHPPASTWQILYPGTDTAAIRVSSTTANLGNIGTDDSSFTHYRARVEAKFDTYGTTNGGMTYHTHENYIRMNNNWPRSIEFQFKQDQTGDAFSIQQVTFNIRGNGATWVPTGGTAQTGCEFGCNRRSFSASPHISTAAAPGTATGGATRWLRYLLIARGSDSATHIVNDTVVLTLSNIRIFNDSTKNTGSTASNSSSASNKTPNGPYGSGGLGLQSEGGLINYRRWEIMQFPPSTPKNEPYLHRLVLTNRQPIRPAVNTPVTILWRSIGTIPKVKLQYKMGAGAWLPITDSTTNSGTFSWTSPATITDSLRFRISGNDYVIPDSTGTFSTTGIHPGSKTFSRFTLDNHGLTLLDIAAFKEAGITDVFGREVRVMPVNGNDFHWDFTDAKGARVSKGLYFVRLKGSGFSQTIRVPVF